jgi:tetratricopeptide (TPR) repeat protein
VRTFVIPYCWLALALTGVGPGLASAQVIHLKNGDVIYADQIKENENRVQYSISDDTYTIPKALIQSIDQARPRPTGVPTLATELPVYTPSTPAAGEDHLLERIIRDGQVNRDALNSIESRGNAAETAIAFYIAGRQEFQSGKYDQARRDFEAALHQDPRNPSILNYYAALLVKTGNAQEAVSNAQRAAGLAADSADALAVLGYAQYAANRPRDAMQSWKRSLALRPDASIQQLLARAEREAAAEGNYSERETGHFVLRYEGTQSSEALRRQILATLESEYEELAREFGVEPRSSIQVILYTNQAFFDVTQAPSWTGALNDGKLRIPLQGLGSVAPDLARVLKHELAHSFVNQLSMGRCPHWLNEGIAQALEPKSLGPRGPRLAQLFKLEQEIPLNALEGGFSSFSASEAMLAYDESLATVEYMWRGYGMSDILRILERLGRGDSVEAALRSTIHCDYRQLQDEVGAALLRQFGN